LSVHALDRDLPIPAGADDLSQAEGVIGVGLVDLKAQRRLSVAGIEADDGDTAAAEIERHQLESCPVSSPTRTAAGAYFRTVPVIASGVSRRALAAPDHGRLVVDDANGCGFERHIEADIAAAG
jgi:hypothetical protein